MLEFDRSAAARTHILDDQEDYFVSSNSMWSTQEEQVSAREKEKERQKMLHERQKQKLRQAGGFPHVIRITHGAIKISLGELEQHEQEED